ncbi:MAG TPA: extracellular solute-binding protein [Natronosporangium sp.]|nr:extracellular solute-binding protein [Natronosporangium sp.]
MNGTLRRGTVALSATVALLLASACGSDSGGSDGGAGWWHIQTGEQALSDLFPQLAEEFNEANDANIQPEPIANDDFKPALTTAMQAGDPPDIFHSWGGGVLAQYVRADLVRDITDEVSDVVKNMSPGALAPYTIDGRIYGLPFDMGMVGMWYNKALFEEAGLDPDNPPATWSEFLDAVTTLKEAGITPIALAGSAPWTQHYWFSYLAIRVMGVDGYTAAREAKSFDDPGFLRAAELWKELVDMEPFQSGFLQQGYGGEDSSPAVFGAGGAAMHLMGQWDPSVQESSSGTSLGDDLGWFPFPAVEGGKGSINEVYGGGNGHAVGANAPDYAVDFLVFLATEAYDRILEQEPSIIPVTLDAEIPASEVNRILIKETVANASAFQLYFDQDLPPAVGDQVNASVAAITDGSLTPEEAVQQMHDTFQAEPDFAVEK